MKRKGNLLPKIYDMENIEYADSRARKNKGHRYGIKKHDKNRKRDNLTIHFALKSLTYKTSKYSTFKIYEPKEREIFRLPYYPDRITHHAIMNIMEPIWTKIFTKDTYSCIKGRGIHKLVKNLLRDLLNDKVGTTYCAKMDIRKFYPSINHDILKLIIRKKVKDKGLLTILDEIIDSAEGVPIGNYLSLYFANLYLAYFDHWVKEELRVKYYYRYADDIVILSDSKDKLRNWLLAIKVYLSSVLKLQLKPNYLIFPVESRGIDYVGYVFRHNYTLLRKSIKKKLIKIVNNYNPSKIQSLISYCGWLKYCNSKNLLKLIQLKTGFHYYGWNGKRSTFNRFKRVFILNVEHRNSYSVVLCIRNGKKYEIRSARINFPKILKIQ